MIDTTQKTQTPQTARLAKKIRRKREHGKHGKETLWRVVQEQFGYGKVSMGELWKIAYEGREPADKRIREALGLRDICLKCLRPFRKANKKLNEPKSKARKWWDGLSKENKNKVLQWMYDNFSGEL